MVFVEVFVLLFLTLNFIIWKRSNYYKGIELPPGPIRWPIIGSIPQMLMIDKEYPYKQFTKLGEQYGGIMSIGLGVHYAVVISKFEIIKDLLKRPELCKERYPAPFTIQRTNGRNLGVAWSHGEVWAEVRKFTIKKLREFGFGKAAFIEETIKDELDSLMRYIREESENSDSVWKIHKNRIAMVSINVLWSSVAGYRFDPTTNLLKRHIEMTTEIIELLRPTLFLQVFPFLNFFPKWSGYKRNEEIIKTMWDLIRDQIDDAKVKREGKVAGETDSFVDAFLDEIEKNRANPDTIVTDDQLAMILMDLFVGATETTTATINWIIQYFALFPKVQARARVEILKMSENGTKLIPLATRSTMPYVVACIYETFRHSPFGSVPPTRRTSSDVIYGNYVIPKGTWVIYNFYPVFHDTEYWGDPEEFRPERLLDPSGTTLNSEKIERIAQFGFGKRACPGESMALDVIFSFIVTLLLTFSVEVKVGQEPTLKPGTPSLSIGPANYVAKFVPLIN